MEVCSLTMAEATQHHVQPWKDMCEMENRTQHKSFKPFSAPRDVPVVLTKSPEAEKESRDGKVQFLYNSYLFTFFPEAF